MFAEFEKERKVNTDAIADMAIENFTEMRDRVADSRFLFRKKVELALEAKYPQLFVPKYAMVTFHRIPYSVALARGTIQDRMLAELCESINRVEDLDWDKADRLIHRDLTPLEFAAVTNVQFQPGKDFAIAMDERDPLKEFAIASCFLNTNGGDCVYLCGHSLGLQPKAAAAYVEQELKDWARAWCGGPLPREEPVDALPSLLTEQTAELVGAKPLEVVVMNSLTVNLHLMMVSFYRPTQGRHKIVVERGAFPSDQYAVKSQIRFHGFDPATSLIELTPRPGESCLRDEDIESLIERQGDEIALIMLGGVNYATGQAFDMARITRLGHERGCVVGFDLAHAAGNLHFETS